MAEIYQSMPTVRDDEMKVLSVKGQLNSVVTLLNQLDNTRANARLTYDLTQSYLRLRRLTAVLHPLETLDMVLDRAV